MLKSTIGNDTTRKSTSHPDMDTLPVDMVLNNSNEAPTETNEGTVENDKVMDEGTVENDEVMDGVEGESGKTNDLEAAESVYGHKTVEVDMSGVKVRAWRLAVLKPIYLTFIGIYMYFSH